MKGRKRDGERWGDDREGNRRCMDRGEVGGRGRKERELKRERQRKVY